MHKRSIWRAATDELTARTATEDGLFGISASGLGVDEISGRLAAGVDDRFGRACGTDAIIRIAIVIRADAARLDGFRFD